jgi:antitoxin (DNA-binding transcriptional repressor) of toxin-antitoxin stability system
MHDLFTMLHAAGPRKPDAEGACYTVYVDALSAKDRIMYHVTLDEATTRLPDLLAAAVQGEEVLISDEHHTVHLVLIPHTKKRRQFGSAKGLITMADDFDAPLDDFCEYMA